MHFPVHKGSKGFWDMYTKYKHKGTKINHFTGLGGGGGGLRVGRRGLRIKHSDWYIAIEKMHRCLFSFFVYHILSK